MKRNYAIDFTRAVAILIIVTCHFLSFGGVSGWSYVGHYLGSVGNFIFFAVSALLFGITYEQRGRSAFLPKKFMKKRLTRLFSSLWPFLIVILTIYYFCGVQLNPLKIIMNFVGMGWFGKLPYIGHLWFITMIIFCYCMYVVICKFSKIVISCYKWIILLMIGIIFQTLLDIIHLPGTVFVILIYSLFIFLNSSKILQRIKQTKWSVLICLTIITNIVAVMAYYEQKTLGTTIVHWAGYMAGAFLFVTLMKLGNDINCRQHVRGGIMFLSQTSYEVYLVHHCLCVGTLSVIKMTNSAILNYIILLCFSFSLGWLLKCIGDKLNKLILNK